MEVSIIIPVKDDAKGLAMTLKSISEQSWDKSTFEVIVCNDGGGRQISDVVARFGFVEEELEINRGAYAARNAGIRRARGNVLAFLDADETVTQDWLSSGLAAARNADYVGGRILVSTAPDSSFWERVDAAFAFPVAFYVTRRRYAPTANLFVRRTVFEAVGGFEEALRSGGDREFGVRVACSDLLQQYCEEATVLHPARTFAEQMHKVKRTSRGNAILEIALWRRSAISCAARALVFAVGKLCHALLLTVGHAFSRGAANSTDDRLLTAGRAFIDACYFALLGLNALAIAIRRHTLRSSIPALAPAR